MLIFNLDKERIIRGETIIAEFVINDFEIKHSTKINILF